MLIICILILIVYLVTSNEGFEMRQLTNKEDMQSDFDFISIYNLIAVNLANLNTLTQREKTTYEALVRNIEEKQQDGYEFDIQYIGNRLANPTTTTATTTTAEATTVTEELSNEAFISISKVPLPDSTEVAVVNLDSSMEGFTTTQAATRPAGSPKGYILLSATQVEFLRYYVFLSIIRGIFDQLHRVNNYYFDPSGTNNNKHINDNYDTLCPDDYHQVANINGKEVLTKCILNSRDTGYPDITAGSPTSSLPTINVIGSKPLLNIYVDVITNYINAGLSTDNVMRKILTVNIDNSNTNLVNDIETVIDNLIQHVHSFNLYHVDITKDDRPLTSYNYTLTL